MDFLYVDVLLRCHWRCRLCMCSKRLAGEVGLEKCFSTQRMRVSITPVTERSVSVLLCFAVCLLPTCCAVAKLRTWMKRSNRNSEYLNYCIDAYKCKFAQDACIMTVPKRALGPYLYFAPGPHLVPWPTGFWTPYLQIPGVAHGSLRVRTTDPGKSWNLKDIFSRPGSWKGMEMLIVGVTDFY